MQSFTDKDKKKNKIKFFLILGWVGFFLFVKIRAFTVMVLKI